MTIIKYFEWLRILPKERRAVFELCVRDPQEEDGYRKLEILDKRTALEMIKKNNLPLVYSDNDGMIWESAPLLPCPISHYNSLEFFALITDTTRMDTTSELSQSPMLTPLSQSTTRYTMGKGES